MTQTEVTPTARGLRLTSRFLKRSWQGILVGTLAFGIGVAAYASPGLIEADVQLDHGNVYAVKRDSDRVGTINAQITIRSGLPSFIVTLAFLFILRGLTLVGLKWASGGSTQLRGMKEAAAGSPVASLSARTSCQALSASRKLM